MPIGMAKRENMVHTFFEKNSKFLSLIVLLTLDRNMRPQLGPAALFKTDRGLPTIIHANCIISVLIIH